MFAEPSKLTPPIVTAEANFVAVAALPVVLWLPAALTPGSVMSAVPLKLTPPILLAVASAVAVSALPVRSPVTSPVIVPLTVKAVSVPTEVRELATTLEASVVPVRSAAAVLVTSVAHSRVVGLPLEALST